MSKHHTLKVRVSLDLYSTLTAIAAQAGLSPTELAGHCLLQGVSFLMAHAEAEAQEQAVRDGAAAQKSDTKPVFESSVSRSPSAERQGGWPK